jgi:hypothetical protein
MTRYSRLLSRLMQEIDGQSDSLRLYRLPPDRQYAVRVLGGGETLMSP